VARCAPDAPAAQRAAAIVQNRRKFKLCALRATRAWRAARTENPLPRDQNYGANAILLSGRAARKPGDQFVTFAG
jgi:hypothetical protein